MELSELLSDKESQMCQIYQFSLLLSNIYSVCYKYIVITVAALLSDSSEEVPYKYSGVLQYIT